MADHKQHPTYWPTASHHKDPRTCAKVLCPWLPSWGRSLWSSSMHEASPHISERRRGCGSGASIQIEQSVNLVSGQGWAEAKALECAPPWQRPLCFYPCAPCTESTK